MLMCRGRRGGRTDERCWERRRGSRHQVPRKKQACRVKEGNPTGHEHRQAGEDLAVRCESVTYVYAALGNDGCGSVTPGWAWRVACRTSCTPIINANAKTPNPMPTTIPTKSGVKSAVISSTPLGIAKRRGVCQTIVRTSYAYRPRRTDVVKRSIPRIGWLLQARGGLLRLAPQYRLLA